MNEKKSVPSSLLDQNNYHWLLIMQLIYVP